MRGVGEEWAKAIRRGVCKSIKSWRGLRHAAQFALLLSGAFFSAANPARADTIVEYCAGCAANGNSNQFPGQSVTTPSGAWNNVTFNFYDAGTGAAAASGSLYLFTQAYTGTAVSLAASASSSPGYVATATASGSVYVFSTSLELSGNTQYFFYAGSLPSANGETFNFGDPYAGGQRYFSGNSGTTTMLSGSTSDYAFTLSGTPNPGPIPGSGLLSWLLLGIGGAALRVRQGVALARSAGRRVSLWFGQHRPISRTPA